MVEMLCKNLEKILLILLLLIQEVHNYLFHQMFLKKLEVNGIRLYQILIARVMLHSVMFQRVVTLSLQKLNL
jgi:hypothetical protein